MSLKLCLVMHEKWLNINYVSNWLSFHGVSYPTIATVTFPYVIAWWKIIFQMSKWTQTHLLMRFNGIDIMFCYTWKMILGVTGNVSMVFHTKLLLQSPFIWYSMMENHFTEVKKTTNSFTLSFNGIEIMFGYTWTMTKNLLYIEVQMPWNSPIHGKCAFPSGFKLAFPW